MPSARRSRPAGQASADYVALLALVAVLLAGAGAAVGSPGALAAAVVHHVRTALCIVGGDVCRSADAARRGLEPCVVHERARARMTTMSLLIESGRGGGFTVERLSDGRLILTATERGELGGGPAAGVMLGGKTVGVEAKIGLGWRRGRGWIFPDEAALRRFLRRYPPQAVAREDGARLLGAPRPDFTLEEGGNFADATIGIPGMGEVRAAGRTALGRRVARDGTTTFYADASSTAPLLPGGSGRWIFEVTADRQGRVVRATYRTVGGAEEVVAPLDLDDPQARAASLEIIRLAAQPHHPRSLIERRRLMRLALAHHRIERRRYRTLDRVDKGWGAALGLVGARHAVSGHVRQLVSARLEDGTRRADCLTPAR